MSGFGIFTWIVFFVYLCVYIILITRDLLRKDPSELNPVQEDEDVDISDEVGKFQPIVIEKEKAVSHKKEEKPSEESSKTDKDTPAPTNDDGTNHDNRQQQEPDTDFHLDDDEPKNRKSLSDKGNLKVNPTFDKERIRELVSKLRAEQQESFPEGQDAMTTGHKPPEEQKTPTNNNDGNEEVASVNKTDDIPTEAHENTDSELDDRATMDMRVHIDGEATHVRFSDFLTAEQLSDEAEKAAEDPGEMALREIENGWRLLHAQREKDEEQELLESGLIDMDAAPNITFGKTKT